MAQYEEKQIVDNINKSNQDIKITGNTIEMLLNPRKVAGIHTKGKLDFLVNHKNYVISFVDKFKN